jgi:hypothetical protein
MMVIITQISTVVLNLRLYWVNMRSFRLMEVRQKKRIKLSLPEESKVTRDLKEIRKNA